MFFSGSMMEGFSRHLATLSPDSISDFVSGEKEYPDRLRIRIAGIITAISVKNTRSGERMAFFTVEDQYAEMECVAFSSVFEAIAPLLQKDRAVFVSGALSVRDEETPKLLVGSVEELIENADFNIFLFDSEEDSPEVFSRFMGSKNNYLIVGNKAENLTLAQREVLEKQNVLLISAKQNQNIDVLLDKICAYLSEQYSLANANLITRQRYRENLEECLANLDRFDLEKEIELAAEDIRLACRAIGKITGQVEVSEILDKIFSTFCIGK